VPNVSEISFYIQTPDVVTADVLTAELWRARPGAFSPRSAFPGTSVPGAGGGTAPCAALRQVPRVPGKAALATQASQSAGAAKLGHVNNYNHMTSVYAIGEGASGPPPHREPA
jgi:hypothetical protein